MVTQTFNDGANVKVTAVPHSGNHFVGWQGDLAGDQNPTEIIMDANKNITAVAEEDAPPPIPKRILTINTSGGIDVIAEEIIDPPTPPPGDKYYGRIYLESEANFTVPGDFPDIYSIDYNQIPGGSKILISGTYRNTWRPNGLSNIIFLFKNFVMDGQGNVEHAIYINGGDGVEFHSVDGDNSNAKFKEYYGKIIDQHDGSNMWFDGFHLRTEVDGSGGQTDLFYLQDINGVKITNSDGVIYTQAGGHNDLAQFFKCSDVLVWNYKARQENSKSTNAQGIYNEDPFNTGGFFEVQHCDLYGHKNLVCLRNINGPINHSTIIKNNKIECWGYHPIFIQRSDNWIADPNDISGNYTGDAVTIY